MEFWVLLKEVCFIKLLRVVFIVFCIKNSCKIMLCFEWCILWDILKLVKINELLEMMLYKENGGFKSYRCMLVF